MEGWMWVLGGVAEDWNDVGEGPGLGGESKGRNVGMWGGGGTRLVRKDK